MARKPLSRWQRLLRAALVLALGLVGTVVGFLFWFQTDAGQLWLREVVEELVQGTMGEGTLQIGGLDVRRFGVVEADDVVLTDGEGREVLRIDEVRANYRIKPAERLIVLNRVQLQGGEVDLRMDPEGLLDLQRMFPPSDQEGPAPSVPWDVALQSVVVQGVHWAYGDPSGTLAEGTLGLSGTGRGSGTVWTVQVLDASGELTEPGLGPYTVVGEVAYDLEGSVELRRLDIDVADSEILVEGRVDLDPEVAVDLTIDATLDLDGLERMTGDVGAKGTPNAELGIEGPLTAMVVTGRVLQEQGSVGVDLVVGVDEQITYSGTLTPRSLDLTTLLDAVTEQTTLSGEVELDGAGVSWPQDLTATGVVSLSESVGWGYQVPEATATWALKEGLVSLTGFRYSADWCEVTGSGRLTEVMVDVDIVARCRDLSGLAEFGVPDARGAATVTGRMVADWSQAVTVDFDGYAVGWSLAYADYGLVDRYEGLVSADWDDSSGATAVATRSAIEGISSYGAFIPTAEAGWEVVYTLDGTATWRATFTGRDVVYTDAVVAELSGETTGTLGPDGSLQTVVGVDVGAVGYERFTAEWGRVDLVVVDTGLQVEADLFDGTESVLHLDGGGDYEAGVYRFQQLEAGAETGVRWRAERPVAVTLTESGVTGLDFAVSSAAGRIEAIGTLGTEGPVEALVQTQSLQLAYLSFLFPEAGLYVGTIDADLAITGRAEAVELDGILRANSLMIPGQVWGLSGVVLMDSAPGQILVSGRLDDVQGQLLDFRGSVPAVLDLGSPRVLPRNPISGDAVLQVADSSRLEATFPVLGPLPPCEVAGAVQVGGTLINPLVEGSLGLLVAGGAPQEWFRLDADLLLEDGEVTLGARGYDRRARLLTVDGEASTDIETVTVWLFEEGPEPDMERVASWVLNIDLRVVPLFIPVATLGHFVTMPPDLGGKLSGAVRISGNPERPEFGGGLQLTEAAVGELAIAPAVVGLSPAEGGYTIFGLFGFSDDPEAPPHMLNVDGTVPFVLDLADFDLDREMAREGLKLRVAGDGLPLALAALADPAISEASGLIVIDGTVSGSLAKPVPDLVLDMEEGAFTYADINVRFPSIHLDSTLKGPTWTLHELTLQSEPTQVSALGRLAGVAEKTKITDTLVEGVIGALNEVLPLPCAEDFEVGQLTVRGAATLSGFALAAVDMDICSRAAWLSATEEMTLAVGTELSLEGDWPELQLEGDTQVARGVMVFDEDFFIDQGTLRLDPNLTVIRVDREAYQAVRAEPDFWWPWDINIEVDLNRATQLTAVVPLLEGYESLGLQELRLENAAMDGKLRVHMNRDLLETFGEVSVMRGVVEVMNTDFKVATGNLVFSGNPYNPSLDLDAARNTGRYGIIGVRIGQSAEVPSLEFYSDQDLTNTDILSILLIGVPTDELSGGAGDIMAVVGLMAGGVLTEQVEGLGLGGALFDSFQVSTTGDYRTDDLSGEAVQQTDYTATFGRSLGNRGYLEVEWDASLDDNEVSRWDVTLEFIITRRLQAEFTKTAEDGQAGADLLYTWKF